MKTITIINGVQNNSAPEVKSNFGKNALILQAQKYPDLRFSCPSCGTLDVLIEWKIFDIPLKGHCLDCKEKWFHEGDTL